jgi:mannose-6-phosphate isomerase-like protein (cupin superfamily)
MESHKEFIESGILEIYVLGQATARETAEVERMATLHPEVRRELDIIEETLEKHAEANAVEPGAIVKAFFMAIVDYTIRMEKGENPGSPPVLNARSEISDYAQWLDRTDIAAPDDFDEIFAKILCYTPEVMTAVVWINGMAPQEVHDDEYENFLVLEGTCTIAIEEAQHHLSPGDFLSIPLYKSHFVKVTSGKPCKVLLQRVAA